MFAENEYFGDDKAQPVKLFMIILGIGAVMYGFIGICFLFQDEDTKQLKAEGMFLLNTEQYKESLHVWNKLLEKNIRALDALNGIGVAYTLMGEYDKAEEYFYRALEENPEDTKTIFNKSLLYLHRGDYDQAERYFKELLKLNNQYPEAHYHLGYIEEHRGEYARAKDYYIKELNVNAPCAKAWYGLEVLIQNSLMPDTK